MNKIYRRLEEVAADLNITPRRLRRAIRDFAIPVLRLGRTINFDPPALSLLEEALRTCPDPQDCASSPASTKLEAKPKATRSSARSPASAYAAALRALSAPSRSKRQGPSKLVSCETPGTANVVALTRSAKRS